MLLALGAAESFVGTVDGLQHLMQAYLVLVLGQLSLQVRLRSCSPATDDSGGVNVYEWRKSAQGSWRCAHQSMCQS